MSQGMAREVKNLLAKLSNPELVADELLKRWHRGVLSPREVDYLCQFLIDAGLYKSLLSESLYQMKQSKYTPTSACLACLDPLALSLELTKEDFDAIYLWSEESESQKTLLRCDNLVYLEARFQKIKEQEVEKDLSFRDREFAKYKRQLQAFMTEELWEEAYHLIQDIYRHWPQDEELRYMEKELRYKRALASLKRHAQKNSEIQNPSTKKNYAKQYSDEEQQVIESLLKHSETSPDWAYDVALALFALDETDYALHALQRADSADSVWLEIQILLEAKRFLQCLEKCKELKLSPPESADAVAAISYYEAQALWGLDQHQKAIQLLEEIAQVKGDFRSTHSLLMEWKRKLGDRDA